MSSKKQRKGIRIRYESGDLRDYGSQKFKKSNKESYNVVFRVKTTEGPYSGVMTWISFSSKEDFNKFFTEKIKEQEEVVAEGISKEECIRLIRTTPVASYLNVAIHNSTFEGEIDGKILELELMNLMFITVR